MNGSFYSRRAIAALILSSDSLGAALLGAAMELAGFRPSYAADGEAPPDSIRRTKPSVVLVDVNHPIVGDPASLGPAVMTGATVIFYGPARRMRDLKVLPAAAGAELITLPDDLSRLPAILTAIRTRGGKRASSE